MITDEKLFEVALSYYIKKKLQREIAEELGVSRVQVSKYLAQASERGIVSISVNPPWVTSENEEKYNILFKRLLGLENLILTPKIPREDKAYQFLIEFATTYLNEQYPNTKLNIGIGWGKTIFDLSKNIHKDICKDLWTISPLAVAPNIDDEYFDYSTISSNFHKNWRTQTNKKLLQMLTTKDSYAENHEYIIKEWEELDMLLFGIGISFTRFPGSRNHLFPKEIQKKLYTLDITGDVINNFFDIDGNLFTPKIGELITIPISIIKNIQHKIAIAAGYQKIPSIIGACRSGLVNTLITDVQTAKNVIEYLD